jgi:hypothetical protein
MFINPHKRLAGSHRRGIIGVLPPKAATAHDQTDGGKLASGRSALPATAHTLPGALMPLDDLPWE